MKEIKNIEIIERFIDVATADVDVELDVVFIDGEHVKCMYPLEGIWTGDEEEYMEEHELTEEEYIDLVFDEFYEEEILNEILEKGHKEKGIFCLETFHFNKRDMFTLSKYIETFKYDVEDFDEALNNIIEEAA